MNTLYTSMAIQFEGKKLWIGLVEVGALGNRSEILEDKKEAFVNNVTWASDAEEYGRKARILVGHLGGLFVSEVNDPEPVDLRRAKKNGDLEEEAEDMILRAEDDLNVIIYGTFHTYKKDDA